MNNTIIIAAGGTGGHVFPAICLANELEKRNYKIIFSTDQRGLKYLGKYENTAILQETNTSSRLKLYASLFVNFLKSFSKIIKIKPTMVIGFGGYPSVPFVFSAQLIKIKTIIHEQNAVVGKANKLLSKLATKIATSFSKTKGLPESDKMIHIGNPTRFEEKYDLLNQINQVENKKFTILIFGGSQGAKVFSEKVVETMCDLSKSLSLRVFHQGRESDIEKIKNSYELHNIESTVNSFFDNIDSIYGKADIVISRSGASSLFEIMGFQKPAILIPYEKSINGDQIENAKFLESQGSAIIIKESELTRNRLHDISKDLIENRDKLKQISKNLQKIRKRDSAKKFAELVEETLYN